MLDKLAGGTSVVLLIFYMILALVIYHKVFVTIYFDLANGIVREIIGSLFFSALMTALTLKYWKIAAVIIILIALIAIAKCQSNGMRVFVGILFAIAVGIISYTGIRMQNVNSNQEVTENSSQVEKKTKVEETQKYNGREYGDKDITYEDETYEDEIYEDEAYEDEAYEDYEYENEEDYSLGEAEESNRGEYILPESSSRLLKKSDVKNLSKEECRYARNEIYARHGRKFTDEELQEYFDSMSWYDGTVEPEDFSEDLLSSIEKKNIKLIVKYENK